MKSRLYHSTSQRFIPEFTGIADRYHQEKQRRTLAEKHRRQLNSDYRYRQHLDSEIQKQYASKTLQLSKLQESRQTRFDEIRQKKELEEIRQAQIKRLKQKNIANRTSSRKNIEQARESLIINKNQNYQKIKTDLGRLSEQFKLIISKQIAQKAKCCQSIRQQEAESQKAINDFHRKRNADCVTAYLERIRQERKLRKQNNRRASAIKRNIFLMNKAIQIKNSSLAHVEEEVHKYRFATQPSKAQCSKQVMRKLTQGSTQSEKKVEFEQFQQTYQIPQNITIS